MKDTIQINSDLKLKGSDLILKTDCRTCLFDSSIAKIHEDGECEYCKLQTEQRNQARLLVRHTHLWLGSIQ